jgi:hypothetical protein
MVFGTCTLLLLSLAVYCSRAAQLLLNPNATIFDDINTITHDQVQRQIVIDLLHSRRCDSPTFIVRLSGTSLYIMDLEKHDYDPLVVKAAEQFFYPRKSVYTFTYPVLEDAGTYFIEVLVLFCTSFNSERYMESCLENPQQARNIANLPYSFEHTADPTVSTSNSKRPRWVLGNPTDPDYKNALLPTRYQNRNCGGGAYCDPQWAELAQHRLYDWTDKPDWTKPLNAALSNPNNHVPAPTDPPTKPIINICYVGASHAREFMLHSYPLKAMNGSAVFIWIESKYPNTFSLDAIHQRECSFAIIGYGQWPVSYYEPTSYSGMCQKQCFAPPCVRTILQAQPYVPCVFST